MQKSNPTLFILGDSTGCNYAPDTDITHYYKRVGFGTRLKDYFSEKINIKNLALSGRSSKSFLKENNYKIYLNELKKGDYVIIAFGHNDEKPEKERYTDPIGSKEDKGSFKNSLYLNYIIPAFEKKALPILCTPTVRHTEKNDWSDISLHILNGGDYSECIRELGKELEISVIDNTLFTKRLYEKLGADETKYFHAWPSSQAVNIDNTHFNNYGASWVAYMMADFIKNSDISLKNYLCENISKPDKSSIIINPDYKEKTQTDIAKSKIWSKISSPWMGSVFGDVGSIENINKNNFNIEDISFGKDLAFNLRAGYIDSETNSPKTSGKIAENSDGIAVVFREVDSNLNFSISAEAEINAIDNTDNQTAFGVIILDKIEIDNCSNNNYNYIAASPLKMNESDIFAGFVKTDGNLKSAKTVSRDKNIISKGDKIAVKITKVGKKYTIEYNGIISEITADFTDNIYAGFFVSSYADVTFRNIIFNNEVTE